MPDKARMDVATFGRVNPRKGWRRILDSLADRAAQRARYRKTVAELQALTDRDLADFGYHRSEIPHIARAAAGLA
ncbi:DUF1127 domain-containing protein [Roseovarius sp. SYSU LYC5161]|uniref:DUF1127 domain-containing protein n=1 Tax=Roseovarius halophilus (ex Wu et al. 2025) TaxID=3376060 RepID=UPI00399AF320